MAGRIQLLSYRPEADQATKSRRRIIYRVAKLKAELQVVTLSDEDDRDGTGNGLSPTKVGRSDQPSFALSLEPASLPGQPGEELPGAVLWGEPILRLMDLASRQRAGKIILGAQGRRVWFTSSPV